MSTGQDVNGPGARIELRTLEGGLAPIESPVAQEIDLTLRVQSERRHRDIRLPGAGAVHGLRVRDAREPADGERRVAAAGQGPQPGDGAALVVAGEEAAQVAHDQVVAAVLVEIHDRHVIRIRDLRDGDRSRLRLIGTRLEHDALAHVAGEQVEPAVAVEIDEADVGHRGLRSERVLEPDRAPPEAEGTVVRRRPDGKRRQGGRRGRFVVRGDRLVLIRERDLGRGAGSLRRPLAGHDRRHLLDLGPPGRAREDVGVGHLVAGEAEGLGQGLALGRGLGRRCGRPQGWQTGRKARAEDDDSRERQPDGESSP
jgi:hypothetical protein